jgi:hypothetical protein|nr:MAG TPA: hypothetical protein [Caudoviricetes sp.]
MSNRNNISPFPFFLDKGEQTKWYAFGRDYVYLSPKRYILPFQIQRPELKDFVLSDAIAAEYTDGYLDRNGNLIEGVHNAGVGCIDAIMIPNGFLYINNMPSPVSYYEESTPWQGAQISFVNASGKVIKVDNPMPSTATTWSGMVTIPPGTETIYVTQYNKAVSEENATYNKVATTPKTIKSAVLRDAKTDAKIADLALAFSYITIGGKDYIVHNREETAFLEGFTDKMYLELSDGIDTWYSAYFGFCEPCMRIEWYDVEDFLFDAGAIAYSDGYKNEMFFDAEIGMPEYEFEEEVAERNGYQFPISQISYKKYKFTILVPEEVCDVMRFIRLSDHIRISTKNDTYEATSFLMTPTWAEQGYLAEVACEFTTDTVAKKIGKGVTIAKNV